MTLLCLLHLINLVIELPGIIFSIAMVYLGVYSN